MDRCPICNKEYTIQCRCMLSDRQCPNGHHWHRCPVHHKIVIGESDHGDGSSCSCSKKQLGALDPNQRAGVMLLIGCIVLAVILAKKSK